MRRHQPGFRRFILAAVLATSVVATLALGILVLQMPVRYQGLKPGDRLPHVRLVSPEGKPVDTGTWGGRPTLLILLDPDCPACLMELDNVRTLAPTMPGLRVALLTTIAQSGRDLGPYDYSDPTGALTCRLRRLAVPAVYWIGSDGQVVYARSGARSLADDASTFYALLSRDAVGKASDRADCSGPSLR